MIARKKSVIIGILGMMAVLSSCGVFAHKFEPTENGIYIKKDGSVQSALFMELDGEHYTSDGLKEFVQAEVDRYNANYAEERVEIVDAGLKDGVGKVVYSYADSDTLLEYAKYAQDDSIKFSEMKVLDADTAALYGISDEEILSKLKGKAQLVVIDGATRITTEGKILLAKGKNGDIVHDNYDIVTGVGESYIIFK